MLNWNQNFSLLVSYYLMMKSKKCKKHTPNLIISENIELFNDVLNAILTLA